VTTSPAALAWRLLLAEGPRSLLERWRERSAESARRGRYRRHPASDLERIATALGPFPILNVLPFPLRASSGGVAVTLAARLDEERRLRPVAFLQRDIDALRLEISAGERHAAFHLPLPDRSRAILDDGPGADGWSVALAHVTSALRVRLVHLESVVGLSFPALETALAGLRTVLSAHDFALFCARPNLLEEPGGRFCGFCRDLERCARCLAVDRPGASASMQAAYRRSAMQLASGAAAIVHPSDSSLRRHLELVPDLPLERQIVIPPVSPGAGEYRGDFEVATPPRHVAFVGQAAAHKGLPDFVAAAANSRARHPHVRWSLLGGGTPDSLSMARRAGIERLGYFRPGTLPRRLREHRIDLAVLPSRFPETHSLVLDECLAAGVPVLAADIGALGERTRALGAGWTFDPERGEAALIEALDLIRATTARETPPASGVRQTLASCAAGHVDLYRSLLPDGAQ
jgi:glycosyltransferase involved in cell wall biosynthesis